MNEPLTMDLEIMALRHQISQLPSFTIKLVEPEGSAGPCYASLCYRGDFDPLEPDDQRRVLEFADAAAGFLSRLLGVDKAQEEAGDPPFEIRMSRVDSKTLAMIKGFAKPKGKKS